MTYLGSNLRFETMDVYVHNLQIRNVHVYFKFSESFNKKPSIISFVCHSYLQYISNYDTKKNLIGYWGHLSL
jgi:hypothetical protein